METISLNVKRKREDFDNLRAETELRAEIREGNLAIIKAYTELCENQDIDLPAKTKFQKILLASLPIDQDEATQINLIDDLETKTQALEFQTLRLQTHLDSEKTQTQELHYKLATAVQEQDRKVHELNCQLAMKTADAETRTMVEVNKLRDEKDAVIKDLQAQLEAKTNQLEHMKYCSLFDVRELSENEPPEFYNAVARQFKLLYPSRLIVKREDGMGWYVFWADRVAVKELVDQAKRSRNW